MTLNFSQTNFLFQKVALAKMFRPESGTKSSVSGTKLRTFSRYFPEWKWLAPKNKNLEKNKIKIVSNKELNTKISNWRIHFASTARFFAIASQTQVELLLFSAHFRLFLASFAYNLVQPWTFLLNTFRPCPSINTSQNSGTNHMIYLGAMV